jgi:hypothetical protein
MITNFEEFTGNLTDEEIAITNILLIVLNNATEKNPYKASSVVAQVQMIMGVKQIRMPFNDRKLRKLVNHIRINGIAPLIATKDGYYITYDNEIICKQVESLQQRARSIQMCANGLMKFTK